MQDSSQNQPDSQKPQGESIDNNNSTNNNYIQDGHTELIDRRQLIPMNDVDCKHESYIEDPSDETDFYIAMECSNAKCPVGYLKTK